LDDSFLAQIFDFINEIFKGFNSGVLFFGGPLDIIRYIVDILLITFILYGLLRILRETRAWQLLKGLLLIFLMTIVCSLLGLEMVSFIINNVLYIVALAFVVIFQPELRRALETVGLKSFSSISVAFSTEDQDPQHILTRMIDETVSACVKMSKSFTGALVIFERTSKLSELTLQENAVMLDSSVTDAMLMSIFYKGSPLHDGALLIRNGRIAAARCHIPLADNYHVREDLGTRHRAAIGASELGDAIAIVVSEERGTISVALDGCLYTMESGEDLRSNLRYLLGLAEVPASLAQRLRLRYLKGKAKNAARSGKSGRKNTEKTPVSVPQIAGVPRVCSVSADRAGGTASDSAASPVSMRIALTRVAKSVRFQRTMMFLFSFLVSICLWMYIQITNNPIEQKTFQVSVNDKNYEMLSEKGLDAYYPITSVSVTVIGRKSTIDSFTESDINAYIDYSAVKTSGVAEMTIYATSTKSEYFRIEGQNPETVKVVISESGQANG
jgi:diadenylate cyclase